MEQLIVGGIVCEYCFTRVTKTRPAEYWSFDYGTFERFVDVVEQDPVIADLFLQPPVTSDVFWLEA